MLKLIGFMDIDWKIVGHKKQLQFLENAINRERMAHAYIFAGPDGVGKRAVAFKLAQALICENNKACNSCKQCSAFIAAANADFLEVSDEAGIKIEQVRELIYKLSLKPYMARYKVAVIDNAENMNIESANALLKSLEEPKSHTVIVLITSAPDKLLKTISSRAQKINFGPVAYEEYESLLPVRLSKEQKSLIAAYGSDRPGLALKIARDEEFLTTLSGLDKKYSSFRSADEIERLSLVSELAELEAPQLKNVLDFWTNRLRTELSEEPKKNLAFDLRGLNLARTLLDSNVNSKLLLTNLMLKNLDV